MNTHNAPDEISLRLLDEFARESEISQRALADKLDIALGLVNLYIKRLYKKGHIKIKTLPRNRIKYIVTPKGFTEKSRLTYTYMNCSLQYIRALRASIENAYRKMISEEAHKILLWGDGEIAELCFITTRGLPLKIVGVVSDKREDNDFFGQRIYTVDEIDRLDYDAILVASIDHKDMDVVDGEKLGNKKVFCLK